MPHLDHKGPEGKGSGTGRKLGKCKPSESTDSKEFGKGMGLKRKSGGGEGKGQRLKSSKLFEKQKNIENEDCTTNEK